MKNQFQRTESILGTDATTRLKECRVAVFGAGGVGGYVIEALARSGIGTIDITDSDSVDITNLNRQIIATHDTIGRAKVDIFEERILSIDPDAKVIKHKGLFLPLSSSKNITKSDLQAETALLTENDFDFTAYDYIVDAIDTVASKVDLVRISNKLGIPIISAMGCGNRIDPSLLEVTDIFKTHGDPLARVMRKKLKELGIRKLKVVYSTEEPMKPYSSGKESDTGISAGLTHDNKQTKRAPGSTPFVPASAGLMIASVVVRDLLAL